MPREPQVIRYPRNHLARGVLRSAGRLLIPPLSRLQISGIENLPPGGPLLVAGNHVAFMEVVLMAVFTPWQVEMLGVGDIPPEPTFAPIINAFGYIPIQRGKMDRAALETALSVLRQNGVVGVFPEGGIWDTHLKQARSGVAWLSYHAQAPVLPIGFGGMQGALAGMLRLKRPAMTMNIGQLLPPVRLAEGQPHKAGLEQAAGQILAAIKALIPPQDHMLAPPVVEERFEFQVQALGADGAPCPAAGQPPIFHAAALSRFFYFPVLLDVFRRNLRLPVQALQRLEAEPSPQEIAAALRPILDYLEKDNPYFLVYRFGNQAGAEMQAGLGELRSLAEWAAGQGCRLRLTPVRRYRPAAGQAEVVETRPGRAHTT
jgi:1-acyl-sn-glycerol-3-phosphate acyltransferase